ncbi:chromosome segregation protein [Streptococcus pyogenes]|nr:chromosome segregation protein [Streptococcus pyogenes]
MTKELLIDLPIEDIVTNPYQPRIQFNQRELQDLATSIKSNGLIQPIIVRKSDIFGYELVAGERRLKASKMAGLKKVPAIIKKISTLESMQQAIVENLQRSNLNAIEEAKAYQLLVEKKHMTHDEIVNIWENQDLILAIPYVCYNSQHLSLKQLKKEKLVRDTRVLF